MPATDCGASPCSISFRSWLICCDVNFGLRPNFTPRTWAAFTPARVRSLMRLQSSSARTPTVYPARTPRFPGWAVRKQGAREIADSRFLTEECGLPDDVL